jgi:hypothetical protein
MKGGGYGVLADIILGILGAVRGRVDLLESRHRGGRGNHRWNRCCFHRGSNPGCDYESPEKSVTSGIFDSVPNRNLRNVVGLQTIRGTIEDTGGASCHSRTPRTRILRHLHTPPSEPS